MTSAALAESIARAPLRRLLAVDRLSFAVSAGGS
jgi:hypothetical protein